MWRSSSTGRRRNSGPLCFLPPTGLLPRQIKVRRESCQLFCGIGVPHSVEVRDVELRKRTVGAGLMAVVLMGGMLLVGCDENIEVLRDPDVRVARGMTWAWRPVTPRPTNAKRDVDERPVVSRDVIAPPPRQHLESSRDWNTETNRNQLKAAIEGTLKSKGLVQLSDAAAADFLVDYHVAVKTRKATVQSVYPGGYPGIECGPFGCWSGWGWGPAGGRVSDHQVARRHLCDRPGAAESEEVGLPRDRPEGIKQQADDLSLSGARGRESSAEGVES